MGTRLGTLIYTFILASWVILASGTQHYQESKELPLNMEEAHLETKKSKDIPALAESLIMAGRQNLAERLERWIHQTENKQSMSRRRQFCPHLPTCLLCVCLTGSVYCEEVDPDMTSVPALPKETAYLYARYNKIKKLSQKDFGDIVTLKRIDLTGNLISEIEDGAFSKLTLLEELTLAENQLVRLPMLPTKLTSFSANHNRLKTKGVKATAFKKLTKLRSLYLAHNELEAVPMIPESVRILHIQNNNISTVTVDTFCKSNDTYYIRPNMNEIRMDGNPVILAQYPNSFTCLQTLPIGRYQ